VHDYIPGQVTYMLWDYPWVDRSVGEQDAELLDEYAGHGIGLVEMMEGWNDPLRLYGGDKYTAWNEKELNKFIDLVHQRGMKMTLYASSGFFDKRNPDYRPEWQIPGRNLDEIWYRYAGCSPASPEWRAYLLPRLQNIMARYGVDGLYNDLGYYSLAHYGLGETHISPSEETLEHDAALDDLLGIIYDMVHSYGSVVRIHKGETTAPKVSADVYDYLWIGEGVSDPEEMRQALLDIDAYIVPCFDMSRLQVNAEDELYLMSIPFMRFPLLQGGHPFRGECSMVPGIDYPPEETDFWTRHHRQVYRFYREHPEAPPCMGIWDSVPGRPRAKDVWYKYFALYRPLVTENSHVWIDIQKSNLIRGDCPENVVATVFANEKIYLVLANFGNSPAKVETIWEFTNIETGEKGKNWIIPRRQMLFLSTTMGEENG